MYPIIFSVGSFSLRSYGLLAALGFLFAGWILSRNCRYVGISKDTAANLLLIALIAGVSGSRIFYVIQYFEHYRNNLWEIIRVDRGGLVFYGGFILAMLSLVVYCRYCKVDFVRCLDLFAPALAVAHACGRIGCFLNGCCFGGVTSAWCGVVYPVGTLPYERYGSLPLHPAQLYEALWNLLLFPFFLYLLRKKPRGTACSLYLVSYGIFRFVNEFARGDVPHVFGSLTIAQVIGLFLVPLGCVMLIYFRKNLSRKFGK